MIRKFSFAAFLFLVACAGLPPQESAPLVLKPASYADLPGWSSSPNAFYSAAALAFDQSCARIEKADPRKDFSYLKEAGTNGVWQAACQKFASLNRGNDPHIRHFFEENFQPYAAFAGTQEEGLFTGYYEASLRGSKTRHGVYRYPLYSRPNDLVMVDLGLFHDELKGQRIAGRVIDGSLMPYEDRATIVAGKWPHNDKALVWVDDPVDAFFVQVQGSGAVQMDDGKIMRLGYAGQNGYIYYAIGRELVKRGELPKAGVSMQAIRQWLLAHPDQADEIMNTNRSYVFFKDMGGKGPKGGEGVLLTPGHSLAVDHGKVPYGVPLWADIDYPAYGQKRLQRLMIAQDTGGAIRGAVRGDVFWGHGEAAERMAGPMKAQGRYWLLLPKAAN